MGNKYAPRWLPSGAPLTPHEKLVQRALAEYCFEPAFTDRLDWISTVVLHGRYLAYAEARGEDVGLILGLDYFAAALRRAFDIDPARHSRHWHPTLGRVFGYRHVQGPGAIRVNPVWGEPKRDPNRAS